MPRPRIKIEFRERDAGSTTTFKAAVDTELNKGQGVDRVHNWVRSVDGAVASLVLDARFNRTLDWDRVKTFVTNNRLALVAAASGGKISFHQCTHDDPVVQDCKTTSYSEIVL